MYGDPDLMKQFPFLDHSENIPVGGTNKQLSIQVNTHAVPDADKPFSEVMDELQVAYQTSDPKICAFLGIQRDQWRGVFLPLILHR